MVRLKITLSIFFLSLLISCTKKDKDDSYNQTALLKNLSDNFISKGINDFEIQSIKLNLAVKKYLASKSDIDLENTQAEWKSSIDAWRVCELFNIGDIKTSFLFNRIDSWNTDTTDILLTLKDASIISKNTIELKPSNNVGLYALEYLLFENSNDLYEFQDFVITSGFRRGIRTITMNSPDIISGQVSGVFKIGDLKALFQNAVGSLYTNYEPRKITENQFMDFNIHAQ